MVEHSVPGSPFILGQRLPLNLKLLQFQHQVLHLQMMKHRRQLTQDTSTTNAYVVHLKEIQLWYIIQAIVHSLTLRDLLIVLFFLFPSGHP